MKLSNPRSFDLFQLLLLIEDDFKKENLNQCPWKAKLITLASTDALEFSACEVHEIQISPDHYLIKTRFPALLGPKGALPYSLIEAILKKMNETKKKEFLSLLHRVNHYFIYFDYLSWKKNHPRNTESAMNLMIRINGIQAHNPWLPFLLEHPGLLSVAPHLLSRQPSAKKLELILRDYFRLEVSIEESASRWQALSEHEVSMLHNTNTLKLGKTAFLGKFILLQHDQIKLHFYFDCYDDYKPYLPGSKARNAITRLLDLYLGSDYQYRIRLHIKINSRPGCYLDGKAPSLLGLTSFIISKTPHIPQDLKEQPRHFAALCAL